MSKLVAGRVALTPEGAWDASVDYRRLSFVKYASHVYLAKKDSPAGTLPTDDTIWMDCGNLDISVATVYLAGKVKPDGETIIIDPDGTIHSIATGSANLVSISELEYYALTPEEQEDPDVAYFVYDGTVPDVVVVDGVMSGTSANPVQNRAIKKYVDDASKSSKDYTDTSITELRSEIGTDIGAVATDLTNIYVSIKDYVKTVKVTFDNVSISANSSKTVSKDISSFIPSGYKLLDAYAQYSGSSWFFVPQVAISGNRKDITVYIRNTYSSTDQGQPIITLLCIRDI